MSQVTDSAWQRDETRDATLHQWALPSDIAIYFEPEKILDRHHKVLSGELDKKPGLVLGSGSPSGRDSIVSLHEDGTFKVRQDGNTLRRIPRILKKDSNWLRHLVCVLSHISRFQALTDLDDLPPSLSRMLTRHFKLLAR